MALGSVKNIFGLGLFFLVLISYCCYCIAIEDLEQQYGEFEIKNSAGIPAVRPMSEKDVTFEEMSALLAFKKGVMDDPTGALSGWDEHTRYCTWYGVRCAAFRGNLNRVIGLKLPSSRLKGSISPRIADLTELRHLDLSVNSFTGFIPSELCRLRQLRTISLSSNKLSGFFTDIFVRDLTKKPKITADVDIFQSSGCARDPFHELQVLDLSNNYLTGVISEKLGQYSNLREVKLGNNILMGAIPASLGSLRFLSILSLENNILDGSIPAQLSNCRMLQYFDARNNLLSGKFPVELLQLPDLRYLNLTNNRLDDLNPTTDHEWMDQKFKLEAKGNSYAKSTLTSLQSLFPRLRNFFAYHYAPGTRRELQSLSPPSSPAPAPLLAYAPAPSIVAAKAPSLAPVSAPRKNRHNGRKWALGIIIGFVAGVASGLTFCLVFRSVRAYWNKKSAPRGLTIFQPHIYPKDFLFLEDEETFKIQSSLLGKGASGQVYKACLRNRMLVAIKRIPIRVAADDTQAQPAVEMPSPDISQVRAELETLGKIRHRNLVLLIAYMARPDAHLLIYQYMENGSLHDVLYKVREGKAKLKWEDRYRIAVSVATGMKYLHFDCSPRILHRDIKPSNILLDEDMGAHLGDFGLARLIPDDKSHITTDWAGTFGYVPPEYQHTFKFTEAGDVYAFGITLAVLLTGREPTEESFRDEHGGSIMSWVQRHLQAGTITDIIDPEMEVLGSELGNVELTLKVALFCTSNNSSDRPSSKDVLAMLQQLHGTTHASDPLTLSASQEDLPC